MLNLRSSKLLSLLGAKGIHGRARIGDREVVGFGVNGGYNYKDDAHFPFPAIRFKENTIHVQALKEKEKGDWRHLTLDEKKELYRASFCQTFSEFQHPTGSWKFILGCALGISAWAFWIMMFHHFYEMKTACNILRRGRSTYSFNYF